MFKVTFQTKGGKFILILGILDSDVEQLSTAGIHVSGAEVGLPQIEEIWLARTPSNERAARLLVERGLAPERVIEEAQKADADPNYKWRLSKDDLVS